MTLEENLKFLGTATWTHTQLNEIGQAALKKIELQRQLIAAMRNLCSIREEFDGERHAARDVVRNAEAELAALEEVNVPVKRDEPS